jgi:hypothetical protein
MARIMLAPTDAESRLALKHVLASAAFVQSPSLTAFLHFVVEAVLMGSSSQLKGYTIAVGALGRGADFDPELDAIVRVNAGRIRRGLARYYGAEGAEDAVVICLPHGKYAPTFSHKPRTNSVPTVDAGDLIGTGRPEHGARAARRLHLLEINTSNRAAFDAQFILIRETLDRSHRLLALLNSALADDRFHRH